MAEAALKRRIVFGVSLDMDPTGGSTFVSIGAVVDGWDHGGAQKKMGEIAILTDVWQPKAGAQIDPGDINFMIAYDPQSNSSLDRMRADLEVMGPAIANFRFSYPNTAAGSDSVTEPFIGTISKIGRSFKGPEKMLIAPITLTISGTCKFCNTT